MKKFSRITSVILALALIIGTTSGIFAVHASADATKDPGLKVVQNLGQFTAMDPEKENPMYTKLDVGGTILYAYNNANGYTNFRAYGQYNGYEIGYYPVNLRYESKSNEVTIQLYQAPQTINDNIEKCGTPENAGNWPDDVDGFTKTVFRNVRKMTNVYGQTEQFMYGKIAGRSYGYYHVANNKVKAGSLAVNINAKAEQALKKDEKAATMPDGNTNVQEAVYVTSSNGYKLELMTCGAPVNESYNGVRLAENTDPVYQSEAQNAPSNTVVSEQPSGNPQTPAIEYTCKVEHVLVSEEIPFDTVYTENPELPAGERITAQTGHVGIKNVFYTVIYDQNHNEINRYFESEAISVEPVDTIIVVGTMDRPVNPADDPESQPTKKHDNVVTVTVNEYSPIAITTEYVNDATRYAEEGETVVRKGKEGVYATTYAVTYINGVEIFRKKTGEFVEKAMVPTVISRGTKHHTEGTEIVTVTQPIAIETEYQNDPNKFEDEGESVVSAGSEGIMTITYKVMIRDGVEVSREKTKEEVTKEMQPKVISRGTKQHTETTETITVTEAIPFTTEYWDDYDRFVDEGEKVQTEGADGVRTITYKVMTRDGVEVSREKTKEEVTKEMQPKVILRGAKQHTENVETVTETQPIAIFTQYIDDPNQYADEGESVVNAGSEGVKTITYKVTIRDGVEVSREKVKEEVTKEMQPKVVSRGTKQRTQNVETKYETVTETIPFTTNRYDNDAIPLGEERVWREGENGEKTVTYIIKYVDGVEVSREVDSESVTKEPVSKVVHVGTNTTTYEREYEYFDLTDKYTLRGESDAELSEKAAEHAMKMAKQFDAFHAGSGYLESVGKFVSEEDIEEELVNHVPAIEDSKNYGYGCVRVREVGSDGSVSGWTYYAVLYGSADEVGN